MKKILAFILVLGLLLSMAACGRKEISDNTKTPSSTENNPSNPDNITTATTPKVSMVMARAEYRTFDEALAIANDIVVATYTGKAEKHGTYYDLTFSPVRQLKGSELAGDLIVRIDARNTTVWAESVRYTATSANEYTKGKQYILILYRVVSVYQPSDVYYTVANTFIEEGKIPAMYNSAPVGSHTIPRTEIKDFEQAIAYIEEFLLKGIDTSTVNGTEYIRTTDLSEVVSQTPIIAEVVPIEFEETNENNNTDFYYCKVQNVLKGNISDENITIIFTAGTVEIGSKYIIMLADPGTGIHHTLSSKISVYSSNSAAAEQIKTMVKNTPAVQ